MGVDVIEMMYGIDSIDNYVHIFPYIDHITFAAGFTLWAVLVEIFVRFKKENWQQY